MRLLLLLFACSAETALGYSSQQYAGDRILAVTPHSAEQVQQLQLWREKGLQGKESVFLDFWSSPSSPGHEVKVHVKRAQVQVTLEALASSNIAYRVDVPDFGRVIAQEIIANGKATSVGDHSRYLRYDEYHAAANALIGKCGSQCSKEVIGKSIEGRNIIVYKLGANSAKPTIFLEGGIHAREWISPATLLYMMDQIVSNTKTRGAILSSWNLAISPLSNPDGYEYSHTKDRLWRKNRRQNSGCSGVDLNRNFGYKFGGQGTSTNPCSDLYRGPSAFSEPESQAIRNYVLRNKAGIKAFWSVHAYGQWWLHPYGYQKGVNPSNLKNLLSAANIAAQAIRQVNGRGYTVGHSADLLYPAAGGSDDWAVSEGFQYAYTVELPDTGRYGFSLPPSYIVPVGRETLAGLLAFLSAI